MAVASCASHFDYKKYGWSKTCCTHYGHATYLQTPQNHMKTVCMKTACRQRVPASPPQLGRRLVHLSYLPTWPFWVPSWALRRVVRRLGTRIALTSCIYLRRKWKSFWNSDLMVSQKAMSPQNPQQKAHVFALHHIAPMFWCCL